MKRLVLLGIVGAACGAPAVGIGCGGDNGATNVDASSGDEGGGDVAASDAAGDALGDDMQPVSVTFAYQPQWPGVTGVEVVGGFGESSDWSKTASLVALKNDGTGKYTGSATLPPGTYLYLFRATGDAAATTPDKYVRYALDPLDTAFAACPMQSPTFSKIVANPCSQLTVGPTVSASPVHVNGSLVVDGAAANGWLVLLEREEPQSHHFFVNRVTTDADGSFDLVGSAGHYRVQAMHPTLLNENDLQRDPLQLNALRRAISNGFDLASSDVTMTTPDLAFHSYAQFAPTGDAGALPTQFAFETGARARLAIYGGPGDGGVVDIGDPWFSSQLTTDGGAGFDGGFNTAMATQDAAVPGTRYLWGTEEVFDASVQWTKQTMVFPITWQ